MNQILCGYVWVDGDGEMFPCTELATHDFVGELTEDGVTEPCSFSLCDRHAADQAEDRVIRLWQAARSG
ncbi:MAG: hypothetical protein ACHQ0J_13495 [Candidatus Dormibacterales bacterium]